MTKLTEILLLISVVFQLTFGKTKIKYFVKEVHSSEEDLIPQSFVTLWE